MAIRATQRAKKPQDVLHYCCDCKLAVNPFSKRLKGGFVLAWCPHHRYAIFLHVARYCEYYQKLDYGKKTD